MSLDVSKLEKVVDLSGGLKRARCPACAESGNDKTGVHLRVYADGRFGCCVHPKDKEHRKRIFALAGERSAPAPRRGIVVKVAAAKASQPVKMAIFDQVAVSCCTDDPDASLQVEMGFETVRTVRTPVSKSNEETVEESRTPRTGNQNSLYGAQKNHENSTNTQKEFTDPVRSVRECLDAVVCNLPYLKTDGTLVIPTGSPKRYHWWAGGQSVDETIAEIRERMKSASPF